MLARDGRHTLHEFRCLWLACPVELDSIREKLLKPSGGQRQQTPYWPIGKVSLRVRHTARNKQQRCWHPDLNASMAQ